jgi:succinyl-CoA synthetase beta subunit
MDLMEYQGKALFRRLGIPTTPEGKVVTEPAEAERFTRELGCPVVVKAQVLTGGRGKAGGVKLANDPNAARAAAEQILGLDISGHMVGLALVEPASDIAAEYYLSILYDRVSKGYKVICSVFGGVEIEEVNRRSPEQVAKVDIDPTKGLERPAARQIISQAGFPASIQERLVAFLVQLYSDFVGCDATLFEVNPLVLEANGRLCALDAKVSIDNNALFRHPELAALSSAEIADPLEAKARQLGLQYVKLDGDVGVLGNGAGLVMSTLDVVSQVGGRPANFLDVGGGADADTMAASLSLVLSDKQVRAVLVNIFGGITRCDLIAEGVLDALKRLGEVPQKLIVRLDGTNAQAARRILNEANHPNVVPAEKMLEAAERAVALAAGT